MLSMTLGCVQLSVKKMNRMFVVAPGADDECGWLRCIGLLLELPEGRVTKGPVVSDAGRKLVRNVCFCNWGHLMYGTDCTEATFGVPDVVLADMISFLL
jgi:hypothetical protein